MNKIITLIKITFAIFALSIAAHANTDTEKAYVNSFIGKDGPVPVRVETPYISPNYIGETIKVTFVVTGEGKVENVKLLSDIDTETKAEIEKVLTKWEFKPVQKDGLFIKTNVELPIKVTALE